jgi:hypothetical protein
MSVSEVIATLNRMTEAGVIERYAIGGAVGATFYLEPVATLDVDVFVAFRAEPGRLIVSPQPIFDYLKGNGCVMDGEYVMIAGWPVQFLPADSSLVGEALRDSIEKDVDGVSARVFTAEHLAAVALQTGRAKDKTRLLQFIEAGALDADRFQAILAQYSLTDRWKQFERQFLSDIP